MHELPKDLGKSLRSFRNSVYRHSGQYDLDLEKLEAPDHVFGGSEKQAHETSSSLILHPVLSRPALASRIAADSVHLQEDQQRLHDLSRHSSRHSHHSHKPSKPPARRPLITAPKVADPDPAADRLDDDETPLEKDDFYRLMGMKPPVSESDNPARLGMRNGMYSRIASKYEYINKKYRIFDVLTYVLLVTQLLLGAVFIVLGSLTTTGGESHLSIAILGALSTVIAGSLALMKGQGLPNRLHQMRDDLHNVKFEAEELYWDVAAGRAVLYRDIRKLREDYLRVMEAGRRNHPDTWNAATQQMAAGVHGPADKGKPGISLAAAPTKAV